MIKRETNNVERLCKEIDISKKGFVGTFCNVFQLDRDSTIWTEHRWALNGQI